MSMEKKKKRFLEENGNLCWKIICRYRAATFKVKDE